MGLADSRRIPRVPRYSGYLPLLSRCRVRGCHPLWQLFPEPSAYLTVDYAGPTTPVGPKSGRFGQSSRFARRYSGNHILFSSPAATKMFQFAAFASLAGSPCGGVPPFGHPRIKGRLHLPAAFRSLSRPSSPLGARASSVRPSLSSPTRGQSSLDLDPGLLFSMSMCVLELSAQCGSDSAGVTSVTGDFPVAPLQKGGVPAAPSGTATLLRLSPSHLFRP